MDSNIITILNQLFDGSTPPSTDKLLLFIEETMGWVRNLQSRFDSNDPKVKEEAFREAEEMKRAVESKLGSLADQIGVPPAQLFALMQGGATLSTEDQALVESLKHQFDDLRKQ